MKRQESSTSIQHTTYKEYQRKVHPKPNLSEETDGQRNKAKNNKTDKQNC